MLKHIFSIVCILYSVNTYAESIFVKDIAYLEGVRSNQLIGYGVVSGLDGTGDSNSSLTNESTSNLLKSLGITIPLGNNTFKNVAVVTLTAEIPPFSRIGQKIDVTVSSIGSAKSLKSGILMLTPLKGVDSQVYALAQGSIVIADSKGSQLVGQIIDGATIEKEITNDLSQVDKINLTLKKADFSLIQQLKQKIQSELNITVNAVDARTINIPLPSTSNEKVAMLANIMNITLDQHKIDANLSPKITINTKTSTLILNKNVEVNECQMSIGNISLTVDNKLKINSENNADYKLMTTNKTSLNEIVNALRRTGANIQDITNIIQALKRNNCIVVDIEII